MAADARLVAGRPRRLRHLSQHQRLPVDRDAAGAAAAALDDVQRREQPGEPADAGQRVRRTAVDSASNTFAVDPDFRVGYAHNWQASVQRDLPASLTVIATYLGTSGTHLMQEFLPNTYPAGAANPCPTCPAGFVYLTSNGSSSRHAGQVQVRRRLRNGLTATVQYTLAKADRRCGVVQRRESERHGDRAGLARPRGRARAARTSTSATRSPRSFQYTTGVGVAAARCSTAAGARCSRTGRSPSQLTTGSGLPLTPVYLTPVPGTGVTGTIRADADRRIDRRARRLLSESRRRTPRRRRAVGQRRPQLGHRAGAVLAERRHHADVPVGQPAQPRLAHRRDQRAEPRHLHRASTR